MPDSLISNSPLIASQRECAIINLRGDLQHEKFVQEVSAAIGVNLPAAGAIATDGPKRVVWVGPDDCFVIALPGSEAQIVADLSALKANHHCAVTDVSGGYRLITLSGPQARDILASGCPLDLHPDVFHPGMAAGSVFYQSTITLWMTDAEPRYELLVRRSFADYFWQILAAACRECGLQRQDTV